MTYPLVTCTTLPNFSVPELMVKRRFKDFVALLDLLQVGGRGHAGQRGPWQWHEGVLQH